MEVEVEDQISKVSDLDRTEVSVGEGVIKVEM
jgi:hypothetical protein